MTELRGSIHYHFKTQQERDRFIKKALHYYRGPNDRIIPTPHESVNAQFGTIVPITWVTLLAGTRNVRTLFYNADRPQRVTVLSPLEEEPSWFMFNNKPEKKVGSSYFATFNIPEKGNFVDIDDTQFVLRTILSIFPHTELQMGTTLTHILFQDIDSLRTKLPEKMQKNLLDMITVLKNWGEFSYKSTTGFDTGIRFVCVDQREKAWLLFAEFSIPLRFPERRITDLTEDVQSLNYMKSIFENRNYK